MGGDGEESLSLTLLIRVAGRPLDEGVRLGEDVGERLEENDCARLMEEESGRPGDDEVGRLREDSMGDGSRHVLDISLEEGRKLEAGLVMEGRLVESPDVRGRPGEDCTGGGRLQGGGLTKFGGGGGCVTNE